MIASKKNSSESSRDDPNHSFAANAAPDTAEKVTSKKDTELDDKVESAGDGTVASQHYLTGVRLYSCIGSLFVTMFLMALDQTIVATILTTVGQAFGDFSKINWVTTGFMLPMAVLALSWGKMSMILGRKYAVLAAIVLFELGSLICALANSMDMLIAGRVIAGIGASGIQVLVMVIITEIVPIQQRGTTQGLMGAAFGLASVTGPIIGGAFTTRVTWRWCFYINLPFGGIAFACMFLFFNPPKPTGSIVAKIKKIDYIGTALLSGTLILILLALTFGSGDKTWSAPIVIAFFVVGGCLLIVFLIWNFKFSKDPLIPWFVVKVPSVSVAAFCLFLYFGGFITIVIYTSVYFQVVQNDDALHAGLSLLPMIIPVIIVSILTGLLISKIRYVKPFILAGPSIACLGTGILSLLDVHTPQSKRIGYLIICGIGAGLGQSMMISVQLKAPRENGGVLIATSFATLCRQLGGIVGSTMGQTIFTSVIKNRVTHDSIVPASITENITALINKPSVVHQLPDILREAILKHYVQGFRATWYFAIGMFGAAFIASWFTTNMRIPEKKPGAANAPPPADAAKSKTPEDMA